MVENKYIFCIEVTFVISRAIKDFESLLFLLRA